MLIKFVSPQIKGGSKETCVTYQMARRWCIGSRSPSQYQQQCSMDDPVDFHEIDQSDNALYFAIAAVQIFLFSIDKK